MSRCFFLNAFFQNTLFEWNLLGDDMKSSVSIAEYKRKLFAIIRPLCKSSRGILGIKGVRSLTRHCLEFSVFECSTLATCVLDHAKAKRIYRPTWDSVKLQTGILRLVKLLKNISNEHNFLQNCDFLASVWSCNFGKDGRKRLFLHHPQFDSMHVSLVSSQKSLPCILLMWILQLWVVSPYWVVHDLI